METVRRKALSSHRPQTGKLRPREGGLGPIAWAGKGSLALLQPSREETYFRGFGTKRLKLFGRGEETVLFPSPWLAPHPGAVKGAACSLGIIIEQMEKSRVGGKSELSKGTTPIPTPHLEHSCSFLVVVVVSVCIGVVGWGEA